MVSKRMQELEEVSQELLKVLLSDWADERLRRSLNRQTRVEDKLLLSQASAFQLLCELSRAEETVARTLLERENELQRCLHRLHQLDAELQCLREGGAQLHSTTLALRQQLQELQEESRQLQEAEVQEEQEEVPSAAYVTQLYYKISRIDWDYEAEPGQIRGIHYGPAIAQPIAIDSSRHSRCFLSDYLWSLVPTAW